MGEKQNRDALKEEVKKELLTEHEKKGKFPLWGKVLVGCFVFGLILIPLTAAIILINISSAQNKAKEAGAWASAQMNASITTTSLIFINDGCTAYPNKLEWGTTLTQEDFCGFKQDEKFLVKLPPETEKITDDFEIKYSYKHQKDDFELKVTNTKNNKEYTCTSEGCDN